MYFKKRTSAGAAIALALLVPFEPGVGGRANSEPLLKQMADIATDEARKITINVPYGSEWSVSLHGEERWWRDGTDGQYDHRTTGDVKGLLKFSAAPDFCDTLASLEALLSPGSPYTSMSAELENSVRFLVDLYYGITDPPVPSGIEIALSGMGKLSSASASSRFGNTSIACDACSVDKQIDFSQSVLMNRNGFFLYARTWQNLVFTLPQKTCVRTWPGGSDRHTESCTDPNLYSVNLAHIDTEKTLVPYHNGTTRLQQFQTSYPSGFASQMSFVDVTLQQLRPATDQPTISYATCIDCDDNNLCTADSYIPGVGCTHVDKAFADCSDEVPQAVAACSSLSDWMVEVNRSDQPSPTQICADADCAAAIAANTKNGSGAPFVTFNFSSDAACARNNQQSVCQVTCYGWRR